MIHDSRFTIYHSLFTFFLLTLFAACSKDDAISVAEPTATGTFTDARDGNEYTYITVGQLDWLAENLRFDVGDRDKCIIYQNEDDFSAGKYSTENLQKCGMLYSLTGAQEAVPEGWRIPTDADWTALEQNGGYLSAAFNLYYGGYFTKNTANGASNGSRFKGAWAYFWSGTKDEGKNGVFYFARKKFYSEQQMERLSMEPDAYFLSVRLVRNH